MSCRIPYGQTISYGSANRRNPLPVVLPCHGVIGADGSPTGFGGGPELERFLPEHEGAVLPLA